MIRLDAEPQHRFLAQPGTQAFAQHLPAHGLGGALVEQAMAFRHEEGQFLALQAQRQHRRHHLQLFEATSGEFEQQGGIAFGGQQADGEGGRRPLAMFQPEQEALHAPVATGQPDRQIGGEATQGEQQRLVGFHLEIELHPRHETIGRPVELQRQAATAAQQIQLLQELGGEAPGQGGPGQGLELLQPADAHAHQGLGLLGGETGALHGQPIEQARQVVRGGDEAIGDIGQHARRHRIGRQGQSVAKAQALELLAQAPLQPRPGPQQRQAGLDLQQQRPRIVATDLGAEAVAPGRQQRLGRLDERRVVFLLLEVAGQRLGGGQGQAGAQPQGPRGRIDRLQQAALWRTGKQHQRPLRLGMTAQHGIQRQLRKEDAGPAHGKLKRRRPDRARRADRRGICGCAAAAAAP